VSLTFTEIYMPDGTRVPINAVGLDDKLHMLKGKVTGKNTGKQLALAALTGVGTIGATFAMPNRNQTISQQQMAEEQMVSNSGRGVDQVVQQMEVSQHIVVTLPAGVQMFVTFVAPQRPLTPGVTQPAH
jgi:type IV secretory pathway VirB10-like protein